MAPAESRQRDFSHVLQDFCNTRKRLLNKEKRRFLTLTRAKEFGGTTAFHITTFRESPGEGRGVNFRNSRISQRAAILCNGTKQSIWPKLRRFLTPPLHRRRHDFCIVSRGPLVAKPRAKWGDRNDARNDQPSQKPEPDASANRPRVQRDARRISLHQCRQRPRMHSKAAKLKFHLCKTITN